MSYMCVSIQTAIYSPGNKHMSSDSFKHSRFSYQTVRTLGRSKCKNRTDTDFSHEAQKRSSSVGCYYGRKATETQSNISHFSKNRSARAFRQSGTEKGRRSIPSTFLTHLWVHDSEMSELRAVKQQKGTGSPAPGLCLPMAKEPVQTA